MQILVKAVKLQRQFFSAPFIPDLHATCHSILISSRVCITTGGFNGMDSVKALPLSLVDQFLCIVRAKI